METFIAIAAIILGVVGIVGSVAPGLPGPPLSWFGMLLLYIWGSGTNAAGEPLSTTMLLVWLGIVTYAHLYPKESERALTVLNSIEL